MTGTEDGNVGSRLDCLSLDNKNRSAGGPALAAEQAMKDHLETDLRR
jgi:hypothetical protein